MSETAHDWESAWRAAVDVVIDAARGVGWQRLDPGEARLKLCDAAMALFVLEKAHDYVPWCDRRAALLKRGHHERRLLRAVRRFGRAMDAGDLEWGYNYAVGLWSNAIYFCENEQLAMGASLN